MLAVCFPCGLAELPSCCLPLCFGHPWFSGAPPSPTGRELYVAVAAAIPAVREARAAAAAAVAAKAPAAADAGAGGASAGGGSKARNNKKAGKKGKGKR